MRNQRDRSIFYIYCDIKRRVLCNIESFVQRQCATEIFTMENWNGNEPQSPNRENFWKVLSIQTFHYRIVAPIIAVIIDSL